MAQCLQADYLSFCVITIKYLNNAKWGFQAICNDSELTVSLSLSLVNKYTHTHKNKELYLEQHGHLVHRRKYIVENAGRIHFLFSHLDSVEQNDTIIYTKSIEVFYEF